MKQSGNARCGTRVEAPVLTRNGLGAAQAVRWWPRGLGKVQVAEVVGTVAPFVVVFTPEHAGAAATVAACAVWFGGRYGGEWRGE